MLFDYDKVSFICEFFCSFFQDLLVMEMRACLESDKKLAIEALSKKFEQEKQKCIDETKRKQWVRENM